MRACVCRSVGKACSKSCEQPGLLEEGEPDVLEQQRLRAHIVDVLLQPRNGVCEVQALYDGHDDDGLNHLLYDVLPLRRRTNAVRHAKARRKAVLCCRSQQFEHKAAIGL